MEMNFGILVVCISRKESNRVLVMINCLEMSVPFLTHMKKKRL